MTITDDDDTPDSNIYSYDAPRTYITRVSRYGRYFGPGVDAEVLKVDAETRLVGIKLTTR